MNIIVILKAAKVRIEMGGFSADDCLCARGVGLKGPVGVDSLWCPLCAIEASTFTAKFKPDFYGLAVTEFVADVSGHTFPLEQWIERDETLFHWLETASKESVLAAFDETIARVEKGNDNGIA